MPQLHSNTEFDPEARAIAIVTELEKEVLDEDQMHAALQRMVEVFAARQAYSVSKVNEENRNRTLERRRDRANAKIKGIPAAPVGGSIITPHALVPGTH